MSKDVAHAPLGPLQAVGLAGVHLAEVARTAEGLDPEAGGDDLRGLDGPRITLDSRTSARTRPGVRQVVPQGRGLLAAAIGRAGAAQ